MIAALAAWLLQRGVSDRATRPLAWAIVAVAIVAAIATGATLWLSAHDDELIANDRAAGTAAVMNATVAAERAAGAAQVKRDRAFDAEQTNLQEKADAAAGNGASPLDALFDELR